MGYYINFPDMGTSFEEKATYISEKLGGEVIQPKDSVQIIDGYTLHGREHLPVVLVDNGQYAAAAIAYRHSEFAALIGGINVRPYKIYKVKVELIDMFLPEDDK